MNKYQELYGQIPDDYPGKLPFYLAYPLENKFLAEMEYDRDMERIKSMYPKQARKWMEYVQDECDRMEYEGSMMFDEYPDQIQLQQVARRIYRRIQKDKEEEKWDEHLWDMIQVLLYHEVYNRRCRHHRCKKWW